MSSRVTISLLDLITTGSVAGLHPGMTRQMLIETLGEPDTFLERRKSRSMMTSSLWLYGLMEFHFYDDDTVWMLYTDHIGHGEDSEALAVDTWILGPDTRLGRVLDALLEQRLEFSVAHSPDLIRLTVKKTNVVMTFELDDEPSLTARFSSIQRS